jgi:regulator of cell morphogenesis and NO signaling
MVNPAMPEEAAAALAAPDLVAHILARHHAAHRVDLRRLVALAGRLEAGDPARAAGLVALLARIADTLEAHMMKEEEGLFPAILAGHPVSPVAIEILRDDHGEHLADRERLAALLALGAARPGEAWAGLREHGARFLADLAEHVRLEDEVLFPRLLGAP